jgi:hypothetical protein
MRTAWFLPALCVLPIAFAGLASAGPEAGPGGPVVVAQDHGGGHSGGGGGGRGGGGRGGGGHDGGHEDGGHEDGGHEDEGHEDRGRGPHGQGSGRGGAYVDRGGPRSGHTVEDRVFHRPDQGVDDHGTDHGDDEDHEGGPGRG